MSPVMPTPPDSRTGNPQKPNYAQYGRGFGGEGSPQKGPSANSVDPNPWQQQQRGYQDVGHEYYHEERGGNSYQHESNHNKANVANDTNYNNVNRNLNQTPNYAQAVMRGGHNHSQRAERKYGRGGPQYDHYGSPGDGSREYGGNSVSLDQQYNNVNGNGYTDAERIAARAFDENPGPSPSAANSVNRNGNGQPGFSAVGGSDPLNWSPAKHLIVNEPRCSPFEEQDTGEGYQNAADKNTSGMANAGSAGSQGKSGQKNHINGDSQNKKSSGKSTRAGDNSDSDDSLGSFVGLDSPEASDGSASPNDFQPAAKRGNTLQERASSFLFGVEEDSLQAILRSFVTEGYAYSKASFHDFRRQPFNPKRPYIQNTVIMIASVVYVAKKIGVWDTKFLDVRGLLLKLGLLPRGNDMGGKKLSAVPKILQTVIRLVFGNHYFTGKRLLMWVGFIVWIKLRVRRALERRKAAAKRCFLRWEDKLLREMKSRAGDNNLIHVRQSHSNPDSKSTNTNSKSSVTSDISMSPSSDCSMYGSSASDPENSKNYNPLRSWWEEEKLGAGVGGNRFEMTASANIANTNSISSGEDSSPTSARNKGANDINWNQMNQTPVNRRKSHNSAASLASGFNFHDSREYAAEGMTPMPAPLPKRMPRIKSARTRTQR